ncbi:Uncharacterised protein [Candidatus Burarchaeum australiense]|nr:Uncharacterised protein [Candidatus Burarchaeum australiense]
MAENGFAGEQARRMPIDKSRGIRPIDKLPSDRWSVKLLSQQDEEPLGAYEVLNALRKLDLGSQPCSLVQGLQDKLGKVASELGVSMVQNKEVVEFFEELKARQNANSGNEPCVLAHDLQYDIGKLALEMGVDVKERGLGSILTKSEVSISEVRQMLVAILEQSIEQQSRLLNALKDGASAPAYSKQPVGRISASTSLKLLGDGADAIRYAEPSVDSAAILPSSFKPLSDIAVESLQAILDKVSEAKGTDVAGALARHIEEDRGPTLRGC